MAVVLAGAGTMPAAAELAIIILRVDDAWSGWVFRTPGWLVDLWVRKEGKAMPGLWRRECTSGFSAGQSKRRQARHVG